MLVKKIILPINESFATSVIGLGYFDGVHLGHQELIKHISQMSQNKAVLSSILTFSDSIDKVLGKDFLGEITPLNHRLKLFEELGIDICYVLEFNEEIAKLSKDDFITEILNKLNIQGCVCGQDYHFGYKGQGDINYLKEYFDVDVVDFKIDSFDTSVKISSSTIIKYIKEGRIDVANSLLGKPYKIIGRVIKGLGNGHKIGFPTANIEYGDYVLPLNGVYAVKINVNNNEYKGLCNIGTHPTIDELNKESLEVYILDFDQDIYDEEVEISFIKRLRDEKHFENVENLKKQLKSDTFSSF